MTLGQREKEVRMQPQQPSPQDQGPDPMARQILAVAKEALASAREGQVEQVSIHQQGVEHAMRAHSNNLSEPGHKSFAKSQKAHIMGLCRVRKRNEVPKIWHETEQCRNDEDLHRILERHWSKMKEQRGATLLHSIYWKEESINISIIVAICNRHMITGVSG